MDRRRVRDLQISRHLFHQIHHHIFHHLTVHSLSHRHVLHLLAGKLPVSQRDQEEGVAGVFVGVMPLMLHPRNVLDPLPWDHQVIGGQGLPRREVHHVV